MCDKRPLDMLTAARAAALFSSNLSVRSSLTRNEVTAAIADAVRVHRGSRGCVVTVAGEYGDHPETAVPRMRWAIEIVGTVYPHFRRRDARVDA